MPTPPIRRPPWAWPALWAALALLTALALAYGMRAATRHHLEREAERSALEYARALTAVAPGVAGYLAGGSAPSATLLADLRRVRGFGDVFRFKLYNRDARLVLASEDLDRADAGRGHSLAQADHGPMAEAARDRILAGEAFVELKGNGTARAATESAATGARPAWYSEAYVPVLAGSQVVGAVEVYVDQTARRAGLMAAFAIAGTAAAVVALLVLAAGGRFWLHRLRQQRRLNERVHYLARHDPLSGALNRASLTEALELAARRHAQTRQGFAVLCLDLDRFKEINDALGHAAGDAVLQQATARLRQLVRQGDEVARLGGDEFAVLQSSVGSSKDVLTLAERIVEKLRAPYEVAGQRVLCGASVGAAIFGTDAQDIGDLLHKADVALYRSKTGGRGTFSLYDAEADRQIRQRNALAADLRQAVASEQLSLHYQPLYDQNGTTLTGYEALLRWSHPRRGMVPPAEFIPIAEETGLIDPIGTWVLRRACTDAATWPAPLSVAVNLSAAQFRNGELATTVGRALLDAGLPAHRLELEITESLLMHDTENVVGMLTKLSHLGVRIAMDDFGTGYSSLAYLWRFPFDKVKIDRAFTHNLGEDPKVSLIVRSIISLAHSLNIRVNAEGVETQVQLRALQKHGCDELQGFLLGRPVSAGRLSHEGAATAEPERPQASDTDLASLPTMPMPL